MHFHFSYLLKNNLIDLPLFHSDLISFNSSRKGSPLILIILFHLAFWEEFSDIKSSRLDIRLIRNKNIIIPKYRTIIWPATTCFLYIFQLENSLLIKWVNERLLTMIRMIESSNVPFVGGKGTNEMIGLSSDHGDCVTNTVAVLMKVFNLKLVLRSSE